jgi:hypothetical protein
MTARWCSFSTRSAWRSTCARAISPSMNARNAGSCRACSAKDVTPLLASARRLIARPASTSRYAQFVGKRCGHCSLLGAPRETRRLAERVNHRRNGPDFTLRRVPPSQRPHVGDHYCEPRANGPDTRFIDPSPVRVRGRTTDYWSPRESRCRTSQPGRSEWPRLSDASPTALDRLSGGSALVSARTIRQTVSPVVRRGGRHRLSLSRLWRRRNATISNLRARLSRTMD